MKPTFSYLLVLKYFLAYLGSSVKTTNIQQVIITGKYLFSLKVTQRNVKYTWQKCNYQFGIGQVPGDLIRAVLRPTADQLSQEVRAEFIQLEWLSRPFCCHFFASWFLLPPNRTAASAAFFRLEKTCHLNFNSRRLKKE